MVNAIETKGCVVNTHLSALCACLCLKAVVIWHLQPVPLGIPHPRGACSVGLLRLCGVLPGRGLRTAPSWSVPRLCTAFLPCGTGCRPHLAMDEQGNGPAALLLARICLITVWAGSPEVWTSLEHQVRQSRPPPYFSPALFSRISVT